MLCNVLNYIKMYVLCDEAVFNLYNGFTGCVSKED